MIVMLEIIEINADSGGEGFGRAAVRFFPEQKIKVSAFKAPPPPPPKKKELLLLYQELHLLQLERATT